jgi:hypothetical protein
MKKIIFLGIVFVWGCLFSCITNNKNIQENKGDILFELNQVVISASERILEKLPENTKVALFNVSNEESELTNFVIEEIAAILVNRGGLIIVDRQNSEIIKAEHDFQMSGYVRDDDIISIAGKFGAESVVSCSINGTGILQRLRVRTLDVRTGELQVLTTHIINGIDDQMITSSGNASQVNSNRYTTIKEGEITIDYQYHYDDDYQMAVFDVYLDNTNYYFTILIVGDTFGLMYNFTNEMEEMRPIQARQRIPYISEINKDLSDYFFENKINIRNANIIARIITEKTYKHFE